ncbi:hypothetical protein D3C81_1836170 [compost metagenome]
MLGRELDGQRAAVIARGHAEPVRAVVRRHRTIVAPAIGIGALAGVQELEPARLPRCPLQPEMEPLAEIGVGVGADAQADVVGTVQRLDFDRTGIEQRGDMQG